MRGAEAPTALEAATWSRARMASAEARASRANVGVDITATGQLDLRWMPGPATGSASLSGGIMLNLNILEILGD